MELTYLGTAAAEGWPSLFCVCRACKDAKAAGGKNIRTRSQAVVDGVLLIDFPPDTLLHMLYGKLDLNAADNIIITHSHHDHFFPKDLLMRAEGYADFDREKKLGIYGNAGVIAKINETREDGTRHFDNMAAFCRIEEVFAGKSFTPAASGHTITPLWANHQVITGEQAFIYLIEKDGKALLYANDTGYFPETTWAYLKNKKLNLVSLDCTSVSGTAENQHMGLPCCAKVKQRLMDEGIADDNTIFIAHHFSHNGAGACLHDDMEKEARNYGMDMISYDGMTVVF